MKKIVTVITLMLAFTISANAQDKKQAKPITKEVVLLSPAEAAKNDAVAITEYLALNESQTNDLVDLFLMKHEVMQDSNASIERKKEMSRIVGLKIEASIDSKQLEKLRANATLFNQLKGENTLDAKKSK
ncbi:hypothetical protein [Flavobacterium sp.]|uniref:hypothetical protein n=1 Tax=Flavobacterium sp. TaxID=239 RepID=UPI002B4B4A55|nr:hypothetical protein [Flavobacterium sp.]HLF52303.1 hypothetical protein [Flavobacterium sp.]